ncbi:MAG: Ribosomal RNA small subunit methyltransferase I [Alphaproteobacteria bacterium MarineAlpha5_Bin2]|jgi:16S rRNA (cytidine1402-2'-O)-methyltransferase|nr:16S rRNA (cytidine(1402)-2'-O)-methyltransferase [Alphaproteobacteria bacterium]PPR55054.1 MAG: Ribosomal RNA small subunit methyltransferase I [Alphaproteobacteria bacterium MarineAlpha5_Bin2]PPR56951.1 MAG: Ribosomal RNA small subunit methyltransferase I [Alphaproteobacteria bacterium MarineAlpha5_Bin3]
METLAKGLYIVSTPIGNLDDISLRAKKILNSVNFIICENPKHSLKLLNKLDIKKKLFSLHDYNENLMIKRIEKYQYNSAIALISDAGSPLISDPGYNLIQDYIKKNLYVTTIPGPSSILSSLQLSGLPINNFEFFGFVSKSISNMNSQAKKLQNVIATSVFFISGNRLVSFLKILLDAKINRKVAVCKELTKKNERVFRGYIKKIIDEINIDKSNLKGEFTLLIQGKERKTKITIQTTTEAQIKKLLKKFSLTEVVEIVHRLTDISKKEIYKKALQLKK